MDELKFYLTSIARFRDALHYYKHGSASYSGPMVAALRTALKLRREEFLRRLRGCAA